MKKKMSLEELELELPKIELQETMFLLGGTGYTTIDGNQNDDISRPPGHGLEDYPQPNGPDLPEGEGPSGEIDPSDPVGYPDGNGEHDEEGYGENEYPDQNEYGDNDPEEGNGENNPPPPNGGSNGGSGSIPEAPDSWTDGISADSIDWNIPLDIAGKVGVVNFMDQISTLFQSNSVVADLINQIKMNGVEISFGISTTGTENAHTNTDWKDKSIVINFNEAMINDGGWNNLKNPQSTDPSSSDYLKEYENAGESLLHSVIHELNHALYNSMYMDAKNKATEAAIANTGNPNAIPSGYNIYSSLVIHHGSGIANIFFSSVDPVNRFATPARDLDLTHHSYMYGNSSLLNDYLRSGFEEYFSDLNDYEHYLQDMRDWEENDRDPAGGYVEEGH
ncbi:hypothetical protein ACQY1Q_11195 [Tenacibaculum sp. TC6]|uniref:hypothetical protein n=1 Tax=Tenacibaculum sp. TC6 TaxID=3423223 RepID=UPI003D35E107